MIKIIIADDHDIVREGLTRILELKGDIKVAGEASTGREALRLCMDLKPDVALLDLDMPEMDGIEATRRITAASPETKVLILTMHDSEEYAVRALSAGASGYLLKAAGRGILPDAVRKVAAGGTAVNPEIMEKITLRHVKKAPGDPLESLSDREMQILVRTARGMTLEKIADELSLGVSTVFTYKKRLKQKLGIDRDVDLARFASKHGLTDGF
jgi:two-component system, NarL family, invasion response regulator UvrY